EAYRTGETIIGKEAIAKELRELTFHLHFIDDETFASALPLFRDYSPYDQIPLQYSVQIVGSPDEEPIHRDFLHAGRRKTPVASQNVSIGPNSQVAISFPTPAALRIEMIEKCYAAHIKTSLDAAAINVMRPKEKGETRRREGLNALTSRTQARI